MTDPTIGMNQTDPSRSAFNEQMANTQSQQQSSQPEQITPGITTPSFRPAPIADPSLAAGHDATPATEDGAHNTNRGHSDHDDISDSAAVMATTLGAPQTATPGASQIDNLGATPIPRRTTNSTVLLVTDRSGTTTRITESDTSAFAADLLHTANHMNNGYQPDDDHPNGLRDLEEGFVRITLCARDVPFLGANPDRVITLAMQMPADCLDRLKPIFDARRLARLINQWQYPPGFIDLIVLYAWLAKKYIVFHGYHESIVADWRAFSDLLRGAALEERVSGFLDAMPTCEEDWGDISALLLTHSHTSAYAKDFSLIFEQDTTNVAERVFRVKPDPDDKDGDEQSQTKPARRKLWSQKIWESANERLNNFRHDKLLEYLTPYALVADFHVEKCYAMLKERTFFAEAGRIRIYDIIQSDMRKCEGWKGDTTPFDPQNPGCQQICGEVLTERKAHIRRLFEIADVNALSYGVAGDQAELKICEPDPESGTYRALYSDTMSECSDFTISRLLRGDHSTSTNPAQRALHAEQQEEWQKQQEQMAHQTDHSEQTVRDIGTKWQTDYTTFASSQYVQCTPDAKKRYKRQFHKLLAQNIKAVSTIYARIAIIIKDYAPVAAPHPTAEESVREMQRISFELCSEYIVYHGISPPRAHLLLPLCAHNDEQKAKELLHYNMNKAWNELRSNEDIVNLGRRTRSWADVSGFEVDLSAEDFTRDIEDFFSADKATSATMAFMHDEVMRANRLWEQEQKRLKDEEQRARDEQQQRLREEEQRIRDEQQQRKREHEQLLKEQAEAKAEEDKLREQIEALQQRQLRAKQRAAEINSQGAPPPKRQRRIVTAKRKQRRKPPTLMMLDHNNTHNPTTTHSSTGAARGHGIIENGYDNANERQSPHNDRQQPDKEAYARERMRQEMQREFEENYQKRVIEMEREMQAKYRGQGNQRQSAPQRGQPQFQALHIPDGNPDMGGLNRDDIQNMVNSAVHTTTQKFLGVTEALTQSLNQLREERNAAGAPRYDSGAAQDEQYHKEMQGRLNIPERIKHIEKFTASTSERGEGAFSLVSTPVMAKKGGTFTIIAANAIKPAQPTRLTRQIAQLANFKYDLKKDTKSKGKGSSIREQCVATCQSLVFLYCNLQCL